MGVHSIQGVHVDPGMSVSYQPLPLIISPLGPVIQKPGVERPGSPLLNFPLKILLKGLRPLWHDPSIPQLLCERIRAPNFPAESIHELLYGR